MPSLDMRMDDVRAVMDAAASKSAALLGVSEGGGLAALFAATYPERCQRLVLYGTFARFPISDEVLKPLIKTSIEPGGAA
jgi:pimeloyl-ACP methyl ester carboxylesterase